MRRDREQSLRRRPKSWWRACHALLLAAVWAGGAVVAARADFEIELADATRQKLSPAETRSLGRADKYFSDGKLAEAVAEYDVFLTEFPKSAAASYALVRKGRATQKAGDPAKAIKLFNEALDLYSDSVDCSVPALYFSGQCQVANRDLPAAVKAWKEIAEDRDYRKHPGAAHALGSLAGLLQEQGRFADATKYYCQEALDFPKTREAVIDQLLAMHMIRTPNIEAVREVVRTLEGLEAKPQKELATDERYFWEALRRAVRHGKDMMITWRLEQNQIRLYCRYWAGVMEGKLPGDDETQLELTEYHRIAGLDPDAWIARMDKQFAALQKPGDYGRVVRWILIFGGQPEKAEEYVAKLDFGKMTNATIAALMLGAIGPLPDIARRAFAALRFDEMDDQAKIALLVNVEKTKTPFAREAVPLILARMRNPDSGRMALLSFWTTVDYTKAEEMAAHGLPLADACLSNPACAKQANWLKAGLLKGIGKYVEAIAAYGATDDPPRNLLAIADCYLILGQLDKAVEQWREVGKQFESRAPEMAFKIAYAYRDAGQADKQEAELREIVRSYLKYPDVVERARAELAALKKPQ